jgi:diguanylate cyclase (GGDEF)-like protein
MLAMRNLDFHTACIIYFCSNICITALLAVAFSDSRARGARLWLAGLVSQLAAVPLFALRGVIPDMLSIVLGNGLFALSWSFYWASFDVFFGNRRPQWLYGLPLILAASVCTGLLHDVRLRVIFCTGLFTVQTGVIAVTILARHREFRHRIIFMLASGYILAGISFSLRCYTVVFSPDSAPDPFAQNFAQDLAVLLCVPSFLACTLGFVLLHRERTECEVRHLADVDHLTGLRNRRGFESDFARELRGAAATGTWTSLALIDIDHFKAVNDRYGHGVGDKALVELARLLTLELRDGDDVARIGGDEFCILLSRTTPQRAALVAERLRRTVAEHDWRALGLGAPLTVTIGLASHQGGRQDDGADFMHLADMALLAAKNMARDMVLHADQLAGTPSRAEV